MCTVRERVKDARPCPPNTGSSARVTQFATISAELAPSTLVDDTSMGQHGVLTDAGPLSTATT